MGHLKPREPRTAVLLPAQINTGTGWGAVTICDVSARGLSLRATDPPPRGSFVELRHEGLSIVGQVRWTAGSKCGVQARERIALSALLGADAPVAAAVKRSAVLPNPLLPAPYPAGSQAAARHRRAGQALEWVSLVAVGLLAAGAIAVSVRATLVAPFEQVRAAMSPPPR